MSERATLEAQIGRSLRAESVVVALCPLGLPVVVSVPPILDDGTPFPTRYWLTCPLATARVGRVESIGGIRRLTAWIGDDPSRRAELDAAHERYSLERDASIGEEPEHRPTGGVAGSTSGIKCLHAHYADHAAGNENPVGSVVAPLVEPLDCTVPCVTAGERNPAWSAPK